MFIADLFEDFAGYIAESQPRVVVLYPGRFQPFHLGHKDVFQSLQNQYGRDNVWIGTSNKTDPPRSPFNFSDKVQFMHAAGVPSDRIIQVNNPYGPNDYKNALNLDLANTIMIFVIGAPDLENLDVDSNYTELTPTGRKSKIPPGKAVGDERPLKTFTNLKDCTTADQHQYVLVAKEREKNIQVNGQMIDVSHGTQARDAWNAVRNNSKQRAEYLLQMYGRNDPEIGLLLDKISQTVTEDVPTENPADTYYFFDLTNTTHSFAPIDLKVLGLKQTKSGKWYYRPGNMSPETLWKSKLNHLEQKLNARARAWKPGKVTEEAGGVGVIASKKQAKDPRYSMSLTKDIRPGETERQLRKMHLADSLIRLTEQLKSIKSQKS